MAIEGAASHARRAAFAGGVLAVASLLTLPSDLTREDRHLWEAFDRADRAYETAISLRDRGRLSTSEIERHLVAAR
jgi:hypothetical protein